MKSVISKLKVIKITSQAKITEKLYQAFKLQNPFADLKITF